VNFEFSKVTKKYVPKVLDSNKQISNTINMAYVLQTAARKPLRSIITLTGSGRS